MSLDYKSNLADHACLYMHFAKTIFHELQMVPTCYIHTTTLCNVGNSNTSFKVDKLLLSKFCFGFRWIMVSFHAVDFFGLLKPG